MAGMARAAIIGGGAFGTAMACVLSRSGHDVLVWAREPEVVEAINGHSTNPLFLRDVALVPAIRATGDLGAAATGRDFILVAVPAQHLRGIVRAMCPHLEPGTPVVTCSKGIEQSTLALMPEIIAQELPQAAAAVMSGPSFAREIALDLPCGVVMAAPDPAAAGRLAEALANPRFCVQPSGDVPGVAVAGVMKNVVAIASGIAAGRKLGENARATLINHGLVEAARLGIAKGGRRATFMGLAGIGDMMLTANSLQSRNTSLGVALGEGRRLAEILAGRKEVTEGAHSVEAVAALARGLGVDMPITQALDAVLSRGADLDDSIAGLFARLRVAGRTAPSAAKEGVFSE
jgi:glycerol-3-phosphate dehydrogenase (NAD(P)+)